MKHMTAVVSLLAGLAVSPGRAEEETETDPAPVVDAVDLAGSLHCPSHDRFARAGCPQRIAPWARLTYGHKYTAYNVGGAKTPGILFAGQPLYRDEGTFGVDYDPWYTRVALRRAGGLLYQGGTGQYEPDRKNWPIGQQYRRR
jgi:hypothetical protein